MRAKRGDQALVEHMPLVELVVGHAMTDEAHVDLATRERIDLIGR